MLNDHLPQNRELINLPPLPPSPTKHGSFGDLSRDPHHNERIEVGRPAGLHRSESFKRTTASTTWSSPTKYPATSGRQLSSPRKQTSPVRYSPTKKSVSVSLSPPTLPPPSTSSHFLAPPARLGNRSVSGSSFCMPRSALDMSMLGDCAPPSEMDQTMDIGYDEFGRVSIGRTNGVLAREQHPNEAMLEQLRDEAPVSKDTPATSVTTLPRTASYPSNTPPSNTPPSNSLQTAPSQNSARPFPTSSSASSLSSTGEDTARGIMDVSTILPISTKKTRHLLRGENLLKTETMTFEDESMMQSRPDTMRSQFATKTRSPMPRMHEDVTMDIGALMAEMKGKRAGVEESFVDLLHGDGFDALNQSILGGDESFLPASLRPMWGRSGTMPSPPKRSQAPFTPATFRAQREQDVAPAPSSRSARRRSRSMHESRPQVEALASVRRRLESTSATTPARQRDPITPSIARARLGMAPSASKRISLSAGALPITTNASHRKIELPTRTPRQDPASLARTRSIERRPRTHAGDGSPILPQERLESKRGLSTPASLLTKRSLPPRETADRDGTRGGDTAARPRTFSRPRPDMSTTPGAHKRTGSTPAAVTTQARPIAAPATARTMSRPTSMVRPSTSTTSLANPPRALPRSSSRPGLTSTLPTATSREFGRDASTTTNRASRPPTSSLTVNRSIGSKLSTDPASAASPAKRSDPVALKSRAMSTPACAAARSRPTSSHVGSRIAGPVVDAPKRSMAPPTIRERISATSALPRPGSSRIPPVKSSIGVGAGGLDDLRARLNKLSMRQQTSRPAK